MVDAELKRQIREKMDTQKFHVEDLPSYLQLFTQLGNSSRDIQEESTAYTKRIQFLCPGDVQFYIRFDNGKISASMGTIDHPELTFEMTPPIALGLLSCEIDATDAYLQGDLKIHGSMTDAIKFCLMVEMLREELEE